MLVVDTGVFLAAADRNDPAHPACRDLIEGHPGPLVTTALVVAEAGWLIDRQLGPATEAAFYRGIATGEITVEALTPDDWARVAELVEPLRRPPPRRHRRQRGHHRRTPRRHPGGHPRPPPLPRRPARSRRSLRASPLTFGRPAGPPAATLEPMAPAPPGLSLHRPPAPCRFAPNPRPRLDPSCRARIRATSPRRCWSHPAHGPFCDQQAADPSQPVEGGSANNYDYAYADPVNQFDLDGECVQLWRKKCRDRQADRLKGAAVTGARATVAVHRAFKTVQRKTVAALVAVNVGAYAGMMIQSQFIFGGTAIGGAVGGPPGMAIGAVVGFVVGGAIGTGAGFYVGRGVYRRLD